MKTKSSGASIKCQVLVRRRGAYPCLEEGGRWWREDERTGEMSFTVLTLVTRRGEGRAMNGGGVFRWVVRRAVRDRAVRDRA